MTLTPSIINGVVHQVTEHGLVAIQAGDKALAGAGRDGVANQALLVEAIAQTLLRLIRVVTQLAQQVVGVEEITQVGECRVGFDQLARVLAE